MYAGTLKRQLSVTIILYHERRPPTQPRVSTGYYRGHDVDKETTWRAHAQRTYRLGNVSYHISYRAQATVTAVPAVTQPEPFHSDTSPPPARGHELTSQQPATKHQATILALVCP